jgi:hypothetical protein
MVFLFDASRVIGKSRHCVLARRGMETALQRVKLASVTFAAPADLLQIMQLTV